MATKKTPLLFLIVLFASGIIQAQDSTNLVQRKNTIKLEFTQPLYPNSFVISYERVVRPNQSFCIAGGYEEFPTLISIRSNIITKRNIEREGFKLGAEYRFYLKKENKFKAPRGVYIGPYVSYHDFHNKRAIEVSFDSIATPQNAVLTTDFKILNLGFQLGYQFVFGKRWTLDIVAVGPSISRYKAKAKLDGEFTFDPEEVRNEILQGLLERFPILEDVLSGQEITSKGKIDSWAYGWRYQFHVGYHFGGGKKKN